MHLEQLPSGNWRAVVKYQGRRRSVTRRTKDEARFAGAELLVSLGADPRRSVGSMTVGEIVAAHLGTNGADWSPTYLDDMRRVAARLPVEFVGRRADQVTAAVVTTLYRQLQDAGWSSTRTVRAHELLSGAWKHAVLHGYAASNPCRDAKRPKVVRRDVLPPGTAEVSRLLSEATGVEAVAFRLAAATGCRRGEVVAVQWRDVDLGDAELVVRRSLAYTPASGVVERSTKTGRSGHRVLALDAGTVRLLRAHRHDQAERAVAHGLPTPVWVVSTDAGVTPWRPDLLTHRYVAARRRVGLPDHIRLHDLRHFVATSMLEDGVPLIDVAAQLGHTSISTTERTYAHFMPGRNREAAEERGRRLG